MMSGQTMPDVPEGDFAFTGVNLRLRASLVPSGFVSGARNARFTDGAARTRGGLMLTPWANLASSAATGPEALENIQGAGIFKDPDETKWIVIAAGGSTYYTRPNVTLREIPLPAGVSLSGQELDFLQAMDRFIMFRGTSATELETTSVTTSWTLISQRDNDPAFVEENPDDGTATIPNASWGLAMQNRVFLPNVALGKDIISASDFLNYTRYQPTLASFRVNQGDDEAIIAAFAVPSPDDTPASAMVVFKEHSIYIVSGIIGDLSGLARQDITSEYSAASRKAIWRVGRDVWFVSPKRGVSSIAQTSQNKWQGVDQPVSADIQPLIDRINWTYADKIRAAKVGNFSYISVPLDNGEFLGPNLAGGSYSAGSGGSFGLETGSGGGTLGTEDGGTFGLESGDGGGGGGTLSITVVLGATYRFTLGNAQSLTNGSETLTATGDFTAEGASVTLNGTPGATCTALVERVYAGVANSILVYDHLNQAWSGQDTGVSVREFLPFPIRGEDRLLILTETGYLGIYEAASTDGVADEMFEDVDWQVTTRGYSLRSDLQRIRAKELALQLRTWNPRYTLTSTLAGVNETKTIASARTRSRTRYYHPHMRAAWDPSNTNDDHGEPYRGDYSVDGATAIYLSSGMSFDYYQEATERFRCPVGTRGQHVTFTLTNTQGSCELHGVAMHKQVVDNAKGTKI